MGSYIEINDTLQLSTAQGFPSDLLDIERHRQQPITLDDVAGRVFSFHDKPSARIFQLDPVRVYYVHNIDGRWLFWGHAFIQTIAISKKLVADGSWTEGEWQTAGTYTISQIYDPAYQETFTRQEGPSDRNYFIPG